MIEFKRPYIYTGFMLTYCHIRDDIVFDMIIIYLTTMRTAQIYITFHIQLEYPHYNPQTWNNDKPPMVSDQ